MVCLFVCYFPKVLCKTHPVEFASYFHYCHSLTFDQRPDYGFLKRLFRDLFSREGEHYFNIMRNIKLNKLRNCVDMLLKKYSWSWTYCYNLVGIQQDVLLGDQGERVLFFAKLKYEEIVEIIRF